MSTKPKLELDPAVRAHYESGIETGRLLKGTPQLEFHRTKQIISRYIMSKPARVLDIGGGPGVYARWLAEMGYEVHLIDPVSLHIEQAREADTGSRLPLASISMGSKNGGKRPFSPAWPMGRRLFPATATRRYLGIYPSGRKL